VSKGRRRNRRSQRSRLGSTWECLPEFRLSTARGRLGDAAGAANDPCAVWCCLAQSTTTRKASALAETCGHAMMAQPVRQYGEVVDRKRIHLNLIESSRQLFELDPGAAIEAESGWLFAAGSPTHPVISNAAFRIDDEVDASDFLNRARSFFRERGRGFSVWVRDEGVADTDLFGAAASNGLQPAFEMPEMILRERAEVPALPKGAELRRLHTAEETRDYWRVAASAYSSLGFPAEIFGSYQDDGGLARDNVVAFLAYLEGRPVGIAMTMVSHGVAGIYWVGTVEGARGQGIGRATTAAATNAGFDLGAQMASLQASPMGESVYRAMGYERIFNYQLLMSPPP
jgi:GNAT superfamily N-acetyltransferase